ncbi:hypothetical protein NM208_g12075 [Fusarium decemcellulare]|uniref:Uncharacterized protein n=1 Tax=Fusarium decemcellulare TaxID=57161 RepID=A0ACC1RQ16_9HYPO|nr:hypothetical protein NM208_g12075 [Fusarium decemcellulare]
MSAQNRSSTLYDTLRRVFTQMGRRDLAEKTVAGVDPDVFRPDWLGGKHQMQSRSGLSTRTAFLLPGLEDKELSVVGDLSRIAKASAAAWKAIKAFWRHGSVLIDLLKLSSLYEKRWVRDTVKWVGTEGVELVTLELEGWIKVLDRVAEVAPASLSRKLSMKSGVRVLLPVPWHSGSRTTHPSGPDVIDNTVDVVLSG